MSKSYLCYNSAHLRSGVTVTVSSEAAAYPAENLEGLSTTLEWKASSGTSSTILLDAGSGNVITADTFLACGNNITRAFNATSFTIKANATDSWASPSVSVSVSGTDISAGECLALKTFTSSSYRFWQITVTNSTYPGISKLFLGARLEVDIDLGWNFGLQNHDELYEGMYGQTYINERNTQKLLSLPFTVLNKTEMGALLTMVRFCGAGKPVWVVPDPDAAISAEPQTFAGYYRLASIPSVVNDSYGLYSMSLDLREVV